MTLLAVEVESSARTQMLVRYGWQREVGRFALSDSPDLSQDLDSTNLSRGSRLVVETHRGIEVAEYLGPCQPTSALAGRILRKMLPEDEVLQAHLSHLGQQAYARCVEWLDSHQLESVLLQVEPLLDGQTLLFHFLTEVQPLVQQQVDRLVAEYEAEVAASEFVQRVIQGCGPGCGTQQAAGRGCQSSGGCSNCRTGCGAAGRTPSGDARR